MKSLVVLTLLLCAFGAKASSYHGKLAGVMTGPNAGYDGKVFITIEGAVDQTGGCHTNAIYNYVFDASTPGGRLP